MAKKPLRIADALGFGGSRRDLAQTYRRAVERPATQYVGEVANPRRTYSQKIAQALTPNTKFGADIANRLSTFLDTFTPLGAEEPLVRARNAMGRGDYGDAAFQGALGILSGIPGAGGLEGKVAKGAVEKAVDRGLLDAIQTIPNQGSSSIFDTIRDAGMGQVFRRTPEGAYITVMENSKYAPRPNSVTDFVVPEEFRGKGIGGKMLDEIFSIYGPETISAAASSIPSVKAFYKRGLRPGGNPNASLDDAIKIMKEDSSVTMIKPKSEGIIAYHGSPSDFPKFDFSKMGTGQGAQAYGRGGYFAEMEDVAKKYRDELTGAINANANRAIRQTGNIDAAIARAKDRIDAYSKMDDDRAASLLQINKKELEQLLRMKEGGGPLKGSMYQVKINAKPEEFLDWDKPIKDQGSVFSEYVKNYNSLAGSDVIDPSMAGGDFYNQMSRRLLREGTPNSAIPSEISNFLSSQGVKGIKYLDAGSRGAEKTTSNFVVFDDALIDILKKYGIAVPFLAGGGLLAAQPQQDGGL